MSSVDASLNLKGIGRALIPEITVDIQGESSAGHEPAPSPTPPSDPEIQSESTSLWKRGGITPTDITKKKKHSASAQLANMLAIHPIAVVRVSSEPLQTGPYKLPVLHQSSEQ